MDTRELQEPTDLYLLEMLCIDPKKSYSLIFKKYWIKLVKYAFSIIQDQDQAYDVVQEVFIRLIENENFRSIHTDLKSYLHIAVKNDCLKYLKKKWTVTDLSTLLDSFLVSTHPEATSHALLVKELEQNLETELSELPPRMKQIFELSRHDGLTSKQIAYHLGINDGTVRNQISRALSILKLNL